jgi:DNA helicase HerA-like ATPase
MIDATPTSPPPGPPGRTPLGRVVGTERQPNTPHEFHFWTSIDAPVGIGTIVRVEGTHPVGGVVPVVYGVVTDGRSYTDIPSPLVDVLGFDGDPAGVALAPTERTEIRLYTAAVLRQEPEEPLQPVPMGEVFAATDADVAFALRMDSYLREESRTAIPIGLYHAGTTSAPIHLDADFLLGPEAAHLSISGVSGLATKTSAIEWLLASLFAHFPNSKGSVAAVCFNVKGPDLLYLDQPTELPDEDLAMYERLGVPAKPFENVQYFAPYKADGRSLNTIRSNEALIHNVTPLTWGLREVLQFAEVLLNKDDVDAKADALIDFIGEKLVDREFFDPKLANGRRYRVRSFADLEEFFRDVLGYLEEKGGESWRTHHAATIRKVRNRLINISTRCAGLVTDDGQTSDLPWGSFQDRTVYVVDVALLEEDAQDLIFARVVSKLREHLESRSLGVDHVVVFVDELNKYAPGDGPDTYVRKMLLDIAERGRYLGLVLFGAQQFRSQVHRRVVGNAGTALYGRMDADELATPGYATLSAATKSKLATLAKGQLMVRHPHFTQPIFIRFPRPAVLRGRDGAERFPRASDISFEAALLGQLRKLDPSLDPAWVATLRALHDDSELLAVRNLALQQRPKNVRRFFELKLGSRLPAREAGLPEVPAAIRALPDDPYAD